MSSSRSASISACAIVLGTLSALTSGAVGRPVILSSEWIDERPPYPQCHASTIVETTPGRLVAAWVGGTQERHPDVGIWLSRNDGTRWERPVEVATGLQASGQRLPTWNPVLFQPAKGPLFLFHKVGPKPREWWGMVMTSPDEGRSWSTPRRLPDGILGPIKNKPVTLADGSWLSPSSTESATDGWRVHFEHSSDAGANWSRTGSVSKAADLDAIQPSILFHAGGRLQALCRTRQGVVASTWSLDSGRQWSALEAGNHGA